jgi:PhnB protein
MAAKKDAKKGRSTKGTKKAAARVKRASASKSGARRAPAPTKVVKAIPAGYYTATPYLYLNEAAKALDFYKQAFGATELTRMDAPGGRVAHAEVRIGNSIVMLADEFPDMGARSPKSLGGASGSILLYVPDADAALARAVRAGAKVTRPVELQFWGDKMGALEDPFGHQWSIATHVEDVSPAELQKRMAAMRPPG